MGAHRIFCGRAVARLSAGVHRSRGILDARWRHPALDRRRPFWRRDAAANLARVRPWQGLVAIQHEHSLVTTGPYRLVRNPSYLGLIIASVGWALAFRSAIGVLLMVAMLPALVARMHAEERLLGAHFGAEYEAYRARTWRLIPWLY
ncbi:MAG TPA: isoprenylcysteine carboxylmethyltransferase family protein [Planctomycetaceae bacterium]|nr:isoprenylcysteine carboxylmethyltransferase family protein [Planctomycetaceae bacterium]